MSGSTIGSVVGAGIGWFVGGGPQGAYWGWMIGGAVGAIVDPQTFETPRIDDFNFQSAQDGVPRVFGHGTYSVEQTWLMWRSEPRHVRKKKSAKGGPTQVTNTYYISYAIAVGAPCEGGFKLIEEDGKIVFDARTDAELSALGYTAQQISETRAAQAKFLQNVTMYYGTADQMPDPTMVAVEGAGNVPAYRDTAYFVVKDKDITQRQSIPRYRVVVANCGERFEGSNNDLRVMVTGAYSGDNRFANAVAGDPISFAPIDASTGANITGLGTAAYGNGVWSVLGGLSQTRFSTDNRATWQSGLSEVAGEPQLHVYGDNSFVATFSYSLARSNWPPTAYTGLGIGSVYALGFVDGWWYYNTNGTLCRTQDFTDIDTLHTPGSQDNYHFYFNFIGYGGHVYATRYVNINSVLRRHQLVRSLSGRFDDTEVMIDGPAGGGELLYWMEELNSELVVYQNGGYVRRSGDGFAATIPIGLSAGSITSGFLSQKSRRFTTDAGVLFLLAADGSVAYTDNLDDGFTIVTTGQASAESIVGRRQLTGVPVPDAPGFFIDPTTGQMIGPGGTQIDPCQPTLGEIVATRCENRGVPRDVSELTDSVIGYRVAEPTTDQRIIQGLQPGYFFGASEFDGVLHFPKRGRELTFALTEADFVERDGDPIQWERTQETELLRKVTLAYLDPSVNYTRTTQDWERNAATIQAEGESTVELGITGSKDWAKQTAHKSVKVAWGEPDKATVHVSIARADLVTGAEGTAPYLDGSTVAVRIESIKDEGLVRMLELRRTRASLYESNATGASKPLPAFPGSDIRGPTDGLVLNIPVLVDANDVPGIHWAAAGFTSGWAGAQFQILRAGEWVVAGETTFAANTGTLLEPLPYHAGDMDTANVLHVRMGDDMESITYTQLLQERNPMAILRPDGTAEIVQPQTCVEVAPGEFECTTILRNRLDSGASAHAAGARVVFLDEAVEYASLEPTDIGQTLSYRFVSLGTDPDAAPVQTLDLATMESQREWPVAYLAVEVDGDDYTLTWQPRHRLGSDLYPVRSTNWTGYEVGWDDGVDSHSEVVTTETITFTLPGASGITFSVAQVNQFTGAGPAETVHIP